MSGGILDRIEVFKDDKGEYRYRGKARNHETVATGEGYKRRADVLDVVARLFPGVPIIDDSAQEPDR